MYGTLRPLLFQVPPEQAHRAVMHFLATLGKSEKRCAKTRAKRLALPKGSPDLHVELRGLSLEHPVMLAAGLDKDAEAVAGLFALGFSAVEVGTLTPRPQPGNPKPRLFRLPQAHALINRMGFNNEGAAAAAERLAKLRFRPGPVGVNIGKNKDTPLERAVDDYLACVDVLAPHGDYVVVNASSPNTPGLRALQEPEALERLLRAVRERLDAKGRKPLFLKIAPDLGPEAVDAIVDVAIACGIDGIIATNTTIQRPVEHRRAKEAGGFSGAPLKPLSLEVLRRAYARARGRLALIGVGGIMTAEDVYERIRAGADAVQVYTGFIYGGPNTPRDLAQGLARLLARDGIGSVREAVGKDAAPAAAALS